MTVVSKEQLENASIDAQTLEQIVNGSASPGTLNSRLGTPLKTLAKIIEELANQNIAGSALTLLNERIDNSYEREVIYERVNDWISTGNVGISANNNLQISIPTNGAKGGQLSGVSMVTGEWYQVEFNVVSMSQAWTIKDEWGAASEVTQNINVGPNFIVFQKKANPVVIYATVAGAQIEINNMRVSRIAVGNPEELLGLVDSVNSLKTEIEGNRYVSEFDGDVVGWDGKLFANNQSIVSTNGNLVVTRTGTSAAAADCRSLPSLGFPMPNGQQFDITIEVVSLVGDWELRNRFSGFAEQRTLTVGTNKLTVTRNSANGYYPIIISNGTGGNTGDNIVVSKITVQETGTGFNSGTVQAQIAAAIREHEGVIHSSDFENDESGWNGQLWPTFQTISTSNGNLVITRGADGGQAAADARNTGVSFVGGQSYEIKVDVVSMQGTWHMRDTYSGQGALKTLSVGSNSFAFEFTPTAGQFPVIVGPTADGVDEGDSIVISSIEILQGSGGVSGFNPESLSSILFGLGASSTNSGNGKAKGIVIGADARTNQNNAVVIGNDANGVHVPAYGSLGIHGCQTQNEMVVIGNLAAGGGWRTFAGGAKAHALGQSSTALGCGAVALATHGVAVGRGAWVPDQSQMNFVGVVLGAQNLYMENGWGHQFNTPISGIGVGSKNPPTVVNEYHGQDAFDARYPEWSASSNYGLPGSATSFNASTAHLAQLNGNLYKSLLPSGPAESAGVVQPGVSANWETYWRLVYQIQQSGSAGPGGPTDFNVGGGHARLIAGRATGSATSGTSGLSVTDNVNRGPNQKKLVVEGLYVDSDPGNANTYICFRKTDGTEHRINVEADGTLKAIPRSSINLNYECNSQ